MTRLLLLALALALWPSVASADCGIPVVRDVPADSQVVRYEPTARGVGRDLGVPSDLIERVMWVESRGDPLAVSWAGARGLMQILGMHWLPGEDWTDPYQNIRKGAGILRQNFNRSGDWVVATRWYYGAPGDEYVRLVWRFVCEGVE